MSRFKVGTISVAILFIFLGIGMLINQFNDFSIISMVLTWWPVLLILLGIEILIYLWQKRKEDGEPKVSYDIASMFIVLLFGMISIGLYSIQESGVLQAVKTNFVSSSYTIQTPPQVIDDIRGIKNIKVIGNPRVLNIYTTGESKITSYSNWRNIYAANEEEARQYTSKVIDIIRNGDTLFITINEPININKFLSNPNGHVSLYLPANLEVETDLQYSEVKLYIKELVNSWNIRTHSGSIMTKLEDVKNLTVQATSLHGHINPNPEWTTINEQSSEGQLTIGAGTYLLRLFTEHGYIDLSL